MRLRTKIRGILLFTSAGLMMLAAAGGISRAQRPLPNPVAFYTRPEFFQATGKQMTRYKFGVDNLDAYPKELFAAAPDLPPCGKNTKSSRTWVDLYDQSGKRLNGFCALGSPQDLGNVWFAMESDEVPPSWVYIELTDRKTNTKYKSNLAETVQ